MSKNVGKKNLRKKKGGMISDFVQTCLGGCVRVLLLLLFFPPCSISLDVGAYVRLGTFVLFAGTGAGGGDTIVKTTAHTLLFFFFFLPAALVKQWGFFFFG